MQTKTIGMLLLIAIAIGATVVAIEMGTQSAQARSGFGRFGGNDNSQGNENSAGNDNTGGNSGGS